MSVDRIGAAGGGRRKVLLLEMNEVPWRVLDDFTARHPASHLARAVARGKSFATVCEDQIELDPWTSWPTLHRGVIDEQHGIRHLGQALEQADRLFPPVWELLARGGLPVGVFGSLHSAHVPERPERYAFFVPDCFAESAFAHPEALQPFQAFNLLMTRRSARNVDREIPLRTALAFLRRYLRSGASAGTVGTVLAALCAERIWEHRKSRRRSLQPLLALDVFLHLLQRTRPAFATFYTNHVAANMHRFWGAAFPEDSPANPMPAGWREMYAHEIDYAMRILDRMAGRLRAFADRHDYLLVAAGSIGQSGVPPEKTSAFTTITDLPRFMARLGIAAGQWKPRPAMVPCLSVEVEAGRARDFEARLQALTIGPYAVHRARREGTAPFTYDVTGGAVFHLYVYFNELDPAALGARLGGTAIPAAELGLGMFRQEEGVACSGRHTPFGALIVYDPRRAASEGGGRPTLSTLELAPALLHNFGLPVPDYMVQPASHLLDVARPAPCRSEAFRGGGVETPVTRARSVRQGARERNAS